MVKNLSFDGVMSSRPYERLLLFSPIERNSVWLLGGKLNSTIVSVLACSCTSSSSDCIVSMAQGTVGGGVGSDEILVEKKEMAFYVA